MRSTVLLSAVLMFAVSASPALAQFRPSAVQQRMIAINNAARFNPSMGIVTGNPQVVNPYLVWARQMANAYRAEAAIYNARTVAATYRSDPNYWMTHHRWYPPYYTPWYPPNYYNPWYPTPYTPGFYGNPPYSMPYAYGVPGYGNPAAAPDYGPPPMPVNFPVQAPPAQPSPLSAFGIPSENGAVKWPLAFRLMPPTQKRDLLDPLQSQLQIVTSQAAAGKANQALVKEARHKVESLHQWLRMRRLDLAEQTFRDGEAFVRQIDVALQAMRND